MRGLSSQSLNVIAEAMRIRRLFGAGPGDSVCPTDIAERMKVEVRFVAVASLEGMYVAGESPTILLSTERPAGRRNFTCAHELGHHVLGHGNSLDEILAESNRRDRDPKELAADLFAAHLLMPRPLLLTSFQALRAEAPTPLQLYEISSRLGVGYSTLLSHLAFGLKLIDREVHQRLQRVTPKSLRSEILGRDDKGNVIVVTDRWSGRPVDCEVGDWITFPTDTVVEGAALQGSGGHNGFRLFKATEPGVAQATSVAAHLSQRVRVSRFQYVGRDRFRFEKEVADD